MKYQKVPLVNYPGYSVDTNGCVYNKWDKELNGGIVNGYRIITLMASKNNRVQIAQHRLIALTFIPNPDNKPTVDHIDRNRLNNCVSNLRWATMLEQHKNKTNIMLTRSNDEGIHFSNGFYHVFVISNNEKFEAFFSSLDDAKQWYADRKK